MFEKFSAKATKAIILAQQEARRLGVSQTGTQHILLGLIAENTGIAARVIQDNGITLNAIRSELEKLAERVGEFDAANLPFSARANNALELSALRAEENGAESVQTGHLLLGLLGVRDCTALKVLESLGLPAARLNGKTLLVETAEPASKLVCTENAIESNPHDARSFVNRAIKYEKLGQFQQVIKDCSQAIELDANYTRAYKTRGQAFCVLEKFDDAIADWNMVIQLDPRFTMGWINRGLIFEKLGEYQKAIDDCNKAIEIDAMNVLAYNNRGVNLVRIGKAGEAVNDYDKAIELNANFCLAYANRASMHKQLAKNGITEKDKIEIRHAINDFTILIDRFPNYTPGWALGHRAECHMFLREHQNAFDDATQALELVTAQSEQQPNYLEIKAWVFVVRARAQSELGRHHEAIEDCNGAIALDNAITFALNVRGTIYEKIDEHDKANDDFLKVLELDPKNHYASYGRARTNFKLNFESKLFPK